MMHEQCKKIKCYTSVVVTGTGYRIHEKAPFLSSQQQKCRTFNYNLIIFINYFNYYLANVKINA